MNRNRGGIGAGGIYPNSFLASSNKRSTLVSFLFAIIVPGVSVFASGGGTRSACLGGATSAGEVWALYHNPAGLASLTRLETAFFFIPHQFGLHELKTISFAGGFPVSSLSIGIGVEQFGFALYRKTRASAGVAKEVGESVSGGIVFHYEHLAIRGYGSCSLLIVDAGVRAEPFEGFAIGFVAENMAGARVGTTGQRLPRSASVGCGYAPFHDFYVTLEIEKDARYPASVKAGIEQTVLGFAALRAGLSTRPDSFSLGLALTYANLAFGYAATSHPELGWTQCLDVKVGVNT